MIVTIEESSGDVSTTIMIYFLELTTYTVQHSQHTHAHKGRQEDSLKSQFLDHNYIFLCEEEYLKMEI